MDSKTKILVICNSDFLSGAEISLVSFLSKLNKDKFEVVLLLPNLSQLSALCSQFKTIYLPFIWFQKSSNPIKLISYFCNVIVTARKINKIIQSHDIDIIYSNSIKANIYGISAKLFSGKKNIWHIRDNLNKGFNNYIQTKLSDSIICISKNIYGQLSTPKDKKTMIYGGIDPLEWQPNIGSEPIWKELSLPSRTKLIAIVGQLTPWKNHIDFIKASKIIIDKCDNAYFLIVGDILNPKDVKYKRQIQNKINELGIGRHFIFLGYRQDIKKILNQIDILLHTAIQEPFGRVIIEAMAMEKTVVAYNSGGPAEIILDDRTGFLVEPHNYLGLAQKTLILVENEGLRKEFGRQGRKRVLEEFNIDDSVRNMEKIFDSLKNV